jgi:hypothetical protein
MKALANTRRILKTGATLGALALTLAACGSETSSGAVVAGIVSSDAQASGTVLVKDASSPPQVRTTSLADGSFVLDVDGLTPPFLLEAETTDGEQTARTYSASPEGGWANVNPLTHAALAGAAEDDESHRFGWDRGDRERLRLTADRFEHVIAELRVALQPLFALYGVPAEPIAESRGSTELRAMLRDVRVEVVDRNVFVTNRETGGVIFSAPLLDLASGTFTSANLPGAPAPVPDPTDPPPDPAPEACTYAYSPWATCQPDGTQARTVVSASPEGCTGTPELSQSCTYVPPVTACTAFTYSAWGACQSNGTQSRGVTSSLPAGCTGGSPVVTQSCTYVPPVTACTSFTYSAWAACQSNDTQTRTVTSSAPAGCTGGSPVLTQACPYAPPVCTYTYSAWSACSSSGTQTRTVSSSAPAGCAGTPVLSQACTPPPPPTQSCTTCHGIPPSTGRHSKHSSIATCTTCHGTGYSTTTVNPATHQNGVKNVVMTSPVNWNASTRTCATTCHSSKSW